MEGGLLLPLTIFIGNFFPNIMRNLRETVREELSAGHAPRLPVSENREAKCRFPACEAEMLVLEALF